MARKKRRKKKKAKQPLRLVGPPRFAEGHAVRVRSGTTCPDFPDIPMGGWAGTVTEMETSTPLYLVSWNAHTLAAIPQVYRNRCQRDGCELDCWLGEEDLEPDVGEPPPIEQPTLLRTQPLSSGKVDDRIRMVFGLTSDDPLPPITETTLRQYHGYLREKVAFPFNARLIDENPWGPENGPVRVVGLVEFDPDELEEGLLVEAEQDGEELVVPLADLELRRSRYSHRAITDYIEWFITAEPADSDMEDMPDGPDIMDMPEPQTMAIGPLLLRLAVSGAVYGAALGTLVAVYESASTGAITGSIVLALVGLFLGYSLDQAMRRGLPSQEGGTVNGMIGFLLGGGVGGLLGALILAWRPALVGALAGLAIGPILPARWRRDGWSWLGVILLAVAAPVGWGWWQDTASAQIGALAGAGIGLVGGPLGIFVIGIVDAIAMWRGSRQ